MGVVLVEYVLMVLSVLVDALILFDNFIFVCNGGKIFLNCFILPIF